MIWGVILSKKRRQQLRNRAGPSDGVCPIENRQFQYDLDKNLTGLLVQSGGELLAENQYLYDGNGNRTLKRQLGGDTLYHYDPLNQLKKVEYPSYTEELFYDKAGNRTRRIASGVEELYQYDPRNRLTAYTKGGVATMFQYDHAGNLLADDKARYSYDAFNRTEKVETFDGHIQFNRYDAEGLRYEMEENGNLVQFIFNQDREVVTEEDNSGLNRLIRASELIAANSSADSARTYYHYASDEMGSTTHIVDEAGAVKNRYEYDAWGNITAQEEAVPNRFKFTGQQFDPVTQQYYLRARFYNPVAARFTQEDTYRGDGLNLYAYCSNNPVYYADPTGNAAKAICAKKAAEYNQILAEGGKLTAEQRKELDRYNRAHDNPYYQLEAETGLTSREIYNQLEGTSNKPPKPEAETPVPTPSGREVLGPHYDEARELHQSNPDFFPDPDKYTIVQGAELKAMRREYKDMVRKGILEPGHHVQGLALGGGNVQSNITHTGESTIQRSSLTPEQQRTYVADGYTKNPDFKIAKIVESPTGDIVVNGRTYAFGLNPQHTAATTFQNKVLRWQREVGLRTS